MRILFIISFLISVCTISVAQMVTVKEKTSGYLGQKYAVGFHIVGSPSSEPQKARDGEPSYPNEINVNRGFDIELGAVLSSRTTIVVSTFYSKTSMSMSGFTIDLGTNSNQYSNSARLFTGTPTIRDAGGAIGFRIFRKRKGALAPLGSYIQMAGRFHNINIDASTLVFTSNYSDGWESISRSYKLEDPISTLLAPEIQLGFGVTTAIKDNLLLDFNLVSGYLVNNYKKAYSQDYVRKMQLDVITRMQRKQIINIAIGLTYPF